MSDFAPSHGESIDQERSHAFDGITEYDNSLPRWWLWTLYLSSSFAVWYVFYFHFWTGELTKKDAERFEHEKALAKEEASRVKVKTEDELRLLSKDPAMIAKGKGLMTKTICFTCHGPELTGLIGPNLRDKFWIYGSNMTTIIETITYGRAPLMPPQNLTLKADEIEAIACYVVALNREGEKPGMRPQAAKEKEDPITY